MSSGGNDNLPSFFQLSSQAGSTLEELGGGLGSELGGSLEEELEGAELREDKGAVTLDKIDDDEFKRAMAQAGVGAPSAGANDAEVDFVKMLQDSSNPIPTFEFKDERGPPALPGGFGGLGSGAMNVEALDNLLAETAELDLNTGLPARRGPPKLAAEDVISMVGKASRSAPPAAASVPTGETVPITALLTEEAAPAQEALALAEAPKTNKKGADLLGALAQVGVRRAPQEASHLAPAPGGPHGAAGAPGMPPNMPLPPFPMMMDQHGMPMPGMPPNMPLPQGMPGMPIPPPMGMSGMPLPVGMSGVPMPPPPGAYPGGPGMPPPMLSGMMPPGGMPGMPPPPGQPVMIMGPRGPVPIHAVDPSALPPHLQAVAQQQREQFKAQKEQEKAQAEEQKQREKEQKKEERRAKKAEKAAPGVAGTTKVDPTATNEQGGKLLSLLGGKNNTAGGSSPTAAEMAVAASGERDSLPAHLRADAVGDNVEKSSGPAWKLPVRPFSTAPKVEGEGEGEVRRSKGPLGGRAGRGSGKGGRGGPGGRGGAGRGGAGRGAPYAPGGLANRPRHGQMMSGSDLRFVTEKVMFPLRFDDPYTQDFYYLQKSVKSNAAAREKAVREQGEMPSMIMVPQPLWRDFKERIANTVISQRSKLLSKGKEWEEKEQVLGHLVRTVVTQPKELLSAPTLSAAELDDDATQPFSSRLWQMRQQVQRGYEALSTVQELNHLLNSSNIAADPFARGEILAEVDRAVANLSSALGIKMRPEAVVGSATIGEGKTDATEDNKEVQLEANIVAVIMQSAKGKKLLSRSINLLAPEHRWGLLPVVIARLLSTDPKTQSADDKDVEEKLLAAMLQFVQHSKEYQETEQSQAPPGHVAPFSLTLLKNLRQCVRGVVVAHMEKKALKDALLTSRTRALLLNNITELGDAMKSVVASNVDIARNQLNYDHDNTAKLREAVYVAACEEWDSICGSFMAMLDAAVSS